MELARRGLQSLVLEKARGRREKSCGGGVTPRAARLFERFGLSTGYFDSQGKSGNYGSLEGFGHILNEDPERRNTGYIIEREQLDWDFQKLAMERYGVKIAYDTRLLDLERKDGALWLKVLSGGIERRLECDYVIAADGAASVVRKRLFKTLPSDRDLILTAQALVENYAQDNPHILFHEDYFPAYSWIFPGRDGKANVGIGIYKHIYDRKKADAGVFNRLLARMDPAFADLALRRWLIYSNPFQKGQFEKRVFLVGDAGGYVDPLTGEGLSFALTTGRAMGRTLALMVRCHPLAYPVLHGFLLPDYLRLLLSRGIRSGMVGQVGLARAAFGFTSRSKWARKALFWYFTNG